MRVAISCGHNCTGDTGADGYVLEDNITWRVGQRLSTYLANKGYDAYVCNPNRETLNVRESLNKRITNANAWSPQVYISIHCNAYDNNQAKGTEVYYYPGNQSGEALATEISKELAGLYKTVNRGAKPNVSFMELRTTNCTAILIELAFVTNRADSVSLLETKNDDKACEVIFQAVQRVIGRSDDTVEKVNLAGKSIGSNHVAMEASVIDPTTEYPATLDVFPDYVEELKNFHENLEAKDAR